MAEPNSLERQAVAFLREIEPHVIRYAREASALGRALDLALVVRAQTDDVDPEPKWAFARTVDGDEAFEDFLEAARQYWAVIGMDSTRISHPPVDLDVPDHG